MKDGKVYGAPEEPPGERIEKLELALRYIRDLSHQRAGKEPRDKTLDAINQHADYVLRGDAMKGRGTR